MSENKTLIAYATRGGTTEDYAKAISSVLIDEFKMQADLVNLKKTRNPDLMQYQNIIVGAGIKMFRMHKEGAEFLEKKNFREKNVGIFLSSLVPRDEAIKKYVDVILQKNTTLKPIAVEVFGGRMRIFGRTSQDMTDIEKAKEWTRKIAEHLRS
ncbi:MAG: flavodoxin domain-containing protein [Candidatus Bathyarchaeota archaeon]|nr:flavodoxin domain-containing protein [Candidatus Bathyarchaeota archaeon]MDH5686324.1 flavodoxin domain-containing protein [Candidatus Bathyarchaeota archaeon]